jgi:DNA (cytosine-5)-methyltransferase 1
VKRALDAYGCAGGMGWGLAQAGLEVTGLDISPQPNYPFEFIQADAVAYIEAHGHEYDLVHSSPPCQGWSPLNAYNHKTYPKLIERTRLACTRAGVLVNPVMLCGPSFGLSLYRHRFFEASFPLDAPPHLRHAWLCTRNGYLPTPERPFMSIHGGKHSRAWQRKACEVMGMPWVAVPPDAGTERIKAGIREVCEAVPPAYGRWAGEQFLAFIRSSVQGAPPV